MNHRLGLVVRPFAAVALVTAATAVGLSSLPARAVAPTFTTVPTRLYMVPAEHTMTVPAELAGLVIPTDHIVFDDLPTLDVISRQSRIITVNSTNSPACDHHDTDPANFSLTGCTTVKLTVNPLEGVLRFTPDPSPEDDPRYPLSMPRIQMYRFASGALLQDVDDPAGFEGGTLSLIGTAAEINETLKTLRFTPTVDDPGTADIDEDYYYTGITGEGQMEIAATNIDGSTTADVQIRVLDYNNFPTVTVPQDQWTVADPNVETDLDLFVPDGGDAGTDPDQATFVVADEDNDEIVDSPQDGSDLGNEPGDGDDPDDGEGDEFLVAMWTTCGKISLISTNGWGIIDDVEHVIDYAYDATQEASADPSQKQQFVDALKAVLPDAVEQYPFVVPSDPVAAPVSGFVGVVNDISALNYSLGQVTFSAVDAADNPLGDMTCKVRTLITDLGNNGLPLQYLGNPPTGIVVPMFGVDFDTNYVPAVEELTITVGSGGVVTPTITSVSNVSLAEGNGGPGATPFTFTLALDAPATGTETVQVSTSHSNGTILTDLTDDSDFTPLTNQTVTFTAGASSATFTVPVNGDTTAENNENFELVLSTPFGLTIGDSSGLATVQNDDPSPGVQITTFADVTVAEGNPAGTTPVTFTIGLSDPAPAGGVSVRVTTNHVSTNGADLTPLLSQQVTFLEGQQTRTVTVDVDRDLTVEPSETFTATLSNPVGVTIAAAAQTATGTVTNDDFRTVSIGDVSLLEGNSGTTSFVFDLTLDGPAVGGESVQVSTGGGGATAGVDYTSLNNELVTFVLGSTTASVTVDVNGDPDFEGDDTFLATLNTPVSLMLGDSIGQGTIFNDDAAPDTTDPAVTIDQGAAQTDPTAASPIIFDVVFSEPVTGLTAGDITLGGTAGASTAIITPLTATTYTVAVSGMTQDGTVIASIGPGVAQDAASNGNAASTSTDNTVTYDFDEGDVTPPTVTIDQGAAQSDPTTTSPIVFDVVFSEPVTGFDSADVTLGGTAGATTAMVAGSGATYTVSVSGMTQDGTVTASIGANAAVDSAMNQSAASTSTDNTVTFDFDEGDVTPPTVTINQGALQSDPTFASPIVFDVVFSEAVTGFTNGDVQLGGTALPTIAMVSGSGMNYTVSVSGMSVQGAVIASIPPGAAMDAAANLSAGSTSADNTVTYLVDTAQPNVTINQGAAQSDPTPVAPIVFDVVFTEPVTGFANGDVQLSGTAMPTTAVVAGTGATYTVSVSGMSQDGTVIATIPAGAAADAATNTSNASTSTDNTVTFDFDEGDVTPPTVTIDQGSTQPDPTDVAPIVFDVVFSEPVTGFDAGDIALSGSAMPAMAAVSGSGATYTVLVSGMTQDGTVIATVVPAAAMDAATNASLASTSTDNQVTYDFSVVQPPSPLTITVPADITVPNDPGQPGAVVNYPAPTTNGGAPPVTVSCSSPSGGFYPIGVTTVTCTATDSDAGQQQLALAIATDSFTVTVVDTTPPTTTTPPDSTAPPVTPPATPPASTSNTAPDVGQLPATGGDSSATLVIAAATCLAGAVLLLIRRRARPAA